MEGKKYNATNSANRRRFITNTIKLTVLGTIIAPLQQACNNKKSPSPDIPGKEKKKTTPGSKSKRKKWSHESLVMNSKTNVMHFPTAALYTYYDEIKPKHLQEMKSDEWDPGAANAPRLNKQQSGNILEILTLQGLGKDISDTNLVIAIDTLSIAFGKEYEKANMNNFRLHELMLQLVALNSSIPADQKWQTFTTKVVKPAQLRKRQKWMETESSFNERVNYIIDRKNDYIARLSKRASKYDFN
jgi:hypothetical protein